MSVILRLKRMGRKKIPFYRVIAIDSRRQRDGLELERVGIYNPLPENPVFNVDEDRLFYWLEQGAEVSDTVRTLMKNHGISLKWHLKSQGKSDEEIESEFQKWQLLRESKQVAKAEQEKRAAEESEQKKEAEKEVEEEPIEEVEEPTEADEQEEEEEIQADSAEDTVDEEEPEEEVSSGEEDEETDTSEEAEEK